jgi:EpsI family protein
VNSSTRSRALVALVLMALTGVAAHVWRPTAFLADTKAKVELEQMFPQRFGTWSIDTRGPVQLISPDQKALLNKLYNQTLSRTYVNPQGDRVMLAVAYGGDQSDGTSAHRPDVCYPAQGFDILSSSSSIWQLPGQQLPTRHLLARLGARIEPVSYWVVVGDRIALGGTDQKLAQLAYSTRGLIPDGLLMRVSTIDNNTQRAYQVQSGFVNELFNAMPPPARERIFGVATQSATHGRTGMALTRTAAANGPAPTLASNSQ